MSSNVVKYKRKKLDKFIDFSLLIYFCIIFAHLTYKGINNFIMYFSMLLVFVSIGLRIILDFINNKLNNIVNSYFILYGIFCLICVFSYRWALNTQYVLVILRPLLINLFSALFVMYYIKEKSDLIRIFNISIFAAIYLSVRVILATSFTNYQGGDLGRNIGLNNNYIAWILTLVSMIAMYLYFDMKKNRYLFSILFFIIIIVISGSRKSIIAVMVALVLFILMKDNVSKKIINIILGLTILTIIFIIIMKVDFLYNIIGDRLLVLIKSMSGDSYSTDGSIIERVFYRETAWNLFLQKPYLGWGIHNFAAYIESIGYRHVAYCHNNHLELLADVGIIGYISYYIIYMKIFISSIKGVIRKDKLYILMFIVITLMTIFEYGFVSYYMPAFQLVIMSMYSIKRFNRKKIIKITL